MATDTWKMVSDCHEEHVGIVNQSLETIQFYASKALLKQKGHEVFVCSPTWWWQSKKDCLKTLCAVSLNLLLFYQVIWIKQKCVSRIGLGICHASVVSEKCFVKQYKLIAIDFTCSIVASATFLGEEPSL